MRRGIGQPFDVLAVMVPGARNETAAGAGEVGAGSNADSRAGTLLQGHPPVRGNPNANPNPVGASLARERAAGAGEVGTTPNADSRARHAATGYRHCASPAAMTMGWLAAMPETKLGSSCEVICGDDHERCRSSS
jgi:hypothetical protein